MVDHPAGGWRASIAGREAPVRLAGDTVAFTLPDSAGAFIGRFDRGRSRITGHWIGAYGGNYNDRANWQTALQLIPSHIFPAVAADR